MKKLLLISVLVLLYATANAKIYKWVDENGSVHFSDKPYSQDAKEVNVQGTGISVQKSEAVLKAEKALEQERQKEATKTKPDAAKDKPEEEKVVTEADYRISSSIGKIGADIMSISGRISSGPRCKSMSVTATATNDNGQVHPYLLLLESHDQFQDLPFQERQRILLLALQIVFFRYH